MAVVVFHLSSIRLEPGLVPHGYLAVDFFFVLSGFVVAYAYERALQTSLSLHAFVIKRLVRLYPLAALGAAMGLALLLLKWRFYPDKVDSLPRILISGLFNSLMLPTVFSSAAAHYEMFPGNGPLWTLFFELGVNVLWAWVGTRLRSSALLVVAAVSWLALAVLATRFGTLNIGYDMQTFSAGVARVCFGFPLGVVIYRARDSLRLPALRLGPVLLAVVLLAVLASPVNADHAGMPWWDLLSISLLLPVIVVLGVSQGQAGRLGAFLGMLSYPVYVLHFPLLLVVSALHQTVLAGWDIHPVMLAGLAAIILLAVAAQWGYDEPVRRYLLRAASRHDFLRPRYAPAKQTVIAPEA